MCFSASASLTASVVLIPTGIYCLKQVKNNAQDYLAIAAWPLFFGIQQGFEGIVWLGIHADQPQLIHYAALSFLFFSHGFWLFWVPLSGFYLETQQPNKQVLLMVTLMGFLYGMILYLPLAWNDTLWSVAVHRGSIDYTTHFIYTDLFPKNFSFITYIIIILSPFLISSDRGYKFLGGLIFLALVITYVAFIYAFISVWCFFAAILSIAVLQMVKTTKLLDHP